MRCEAHTITPEMNMENKSKEFAYFNDATGVTYTCKEGFSFNASDHSDSNKTVHCQSSGLLEPLTPAGCEGWINIDNFSSSYWNTSIENS